MGAEMDTNKERVRKYFNSQAKEYDISKRSQFATRCYPYVLNVLGPIQFNNILDVGCGTGTLLAKLLNNSFTTAGVYFNTPIPFSGIASENCYYNNNYCCRLLLSW